MKKLYLALAAAAALVATPALAQNNAGFVGSQVGADVSIGSDDRVGYSVNIGHDFGVGKNGIVGLDVEASDFFRARDRELGAGVRAGVAVDPNALVFARGGVVYHPRSEQTGYAVGGGLQLGLNRHLDTTIQYRFTDYGRGVDGHSVSAGLGLRF